MVRFYLLCILAFVLPTKDLICQGFTARSIHPSIALINGYEGNGVSFADFNHDGLDDISLCGETPSLQLFQNLGDGSFLPISNPFALDGYDVKMITWVDFDNDGDKDAFISCYQGPIRLFERIDDWSFSDITETAGLTLEHNASFGHVWCDYDRDGFLDLYVSNYNHPNDGGTNYFYKNNGDGTFSNMSAISVASDGSNFTLMSAFIDFNFDGWEDLFNANDRFSSTNSLYKNEGGVFTDISTSAGVDTAILSMSNSWADYDRDGYFDVYISNFPDGNLLEHNNGDETFTELAQQAGAAVFDFSWAATWIDFDNNGWEDLHVCVEPFWNQPGLDRFLVNQGDGTFVDGNNFGFSDAFGHSFSSAFGDFNDDGFPDLLVGKHGNQTSLLYENQAVGGHFIKFKCEGVVSNRDGIGCWIRAYVNGEMQQRYTHAGESYLAQYSPWEIIGLGESTTVDSLIVRWPSGIIDTWYNLPADAKYDLAEGSSHIASLNLEPGEHWICANSTLSLQVNEAELLHWSNGSTELELIVSEPGTYYAVTAGPLGIPLQTDSVIVLNYTLPHLEVQATAVSCFGNSDGSFAIHSMNEVDVVSWLWNAADESVLSSAIAAGTYSTLATDAHGCAWPVDITVSEPLPISISLAIEPAQCSNGGLANAQLNASGGTGDLTAEWSGDYTALAPGVHSVQVSDVAGCVASQSFIIEEPTPLLIEIDASGVTDDALGSAEVLVISGTPPYNIQWSNGTQGNFATDLTPGTVLVMVSDAAGCTASEAFMITHVDTQAATGVRLYPNPTTAMLFLEGDHDFVLVFDLNGRMLDVEWQQHGTYISADLSRFASGCYVVRTSQGSFRVMKD